MNARRIVSIVAAGAALCAAAPAVHASALGYSNTPEHYLYTPQDFTQWSFGALYNHQQREVEIGPRQENVKIRRFLVQAGVDVLPWLSLHAAGGSAEMVPEFVNDGDSADYTWNAGVQVRLLEFWMLEPRSNEDRFTIEASAVYSETKGPYRGFDLTWKETAASLTASFVNEVHNDKFIHPWTTRLFFGPAYSQIEGHHATAGRPKLSEQDDLGIVAGIDIQWTRYATLLYEAQIYDSKLTHTVGLLFNF